MYFNFACVDENPLKFVKSLTFNAQDCLMRQFFAISAVSTLLGAEWFDVEPRKTSFLSFFSPWKFFISIPGLNFHFF